MARIILFKDASFQGPSQHFDESQNHLRPEFQDTVTSVIVESGTWQLFEQANFQGRSVTVTPGDRNEYFNLSVHPGGIANDSITSIRLVS